MLVRVGNYLSFIILWSACVYYGHKLGDWGHDKTEAWLNKKSKKR